MRSFNRRAGTDIADGYYRPRTLRTGDAASGLGRFSHLRGFAGNDGSTTAVTAAASNGGAVVATTSAGGASTSTAPAVTPPSVLKQKIGTAKGAHGFLVWAASALPAPVAKAILAAAIARSISYRSQGGQLGVFGDTSDDATMSVDPSIMSPDLSSVTPDSSAFDVGSIDLSSVASDAAPSSSWTTAIGQTATQATASAGLSSTLANAVNSLVSTNLQRASAGQAPLPVAAGAGIGATAAGGNKTLLWGGAVVGVILLLMAMSKK